jgi:hypothetical protein
MQGSTFRAHALMAIAVHTGQPVVVGLVFAITPAWLGVVRGPDGERQVCQPCVERYGFRRHGEDEDWGLSPFQARAEACIAVRRTPPCPAALSMLDLRHMVFKASSRCPRTPARRRHRRLAWLPSYDHNAQSATRFSGRRLGHPRERDTPMVSKVCSASLTSAVLALSRCKSLRLILQELLQP